MRTPLRKRQIITFTLTWFVYACSYLLRKPLGVVKSDLQTSYNLSKTDLGWLDSCYLLPYALMQIILGNLGDKYGARIMLTINLVSISISMFSFGFWTSTVAMAALLFLNGSAQATLWPNCVKSLSEWYDDEQRATIFGIWGTCTFAGGIFGTALAVQLQAMYAPDLKMVFIIPSIVVLLVAVIIYTFLRTPEEMGIEVQKTVLPKHISAKAEQKQLNFFQCWRIRMVPELAWTMFGMKLVRYCLYMWLPMYLNQNLNYPRARAGILSTAFEIGGVFGSAGIGVFIDKFMGGRTHWGVFFALIGSATSLMFFQLTSSWGLLFNFAFLFLAGGCSSGPDSVVSGALASQVGERENAQSAVSGVVNGFGSLGTVLEGPIIAFIATNFGWGGTFYAMIFLTLISAAAIFKAAIMHGKTTTTPGTI